MYASFNAPGGDNFKLDRIRLDTEKGREERHMAIVQLWGRFERKFIQTQGSDNLRASAALENKRKGLGAFVACCIVFG